LLTGGLIDEQHRGCLQTAIRRGGQTLRYLQWFEVVQTRGHIENGEVKHYQVVLKAGFTLEGETP